MSKTKSRPAKARKRTSARATTRRRTAPRRAARSVRLKPLYEQLGRTIDQLGKLPASDRVKFAIARLEQCRADFENICGPTMDIPAEPLPPSA